ncbi:MAG TPA: hypothetical protein VHN20_15745 [Beijerinckiaceae bacterium]|nr:hypothetical protein [Beijerinckiaceae bacterium]
MGRSALRARREHLGHVQYLLAVAAVVATLLSALAAANYALNPYLYSPGYKADVAAAFERGSSFAVFDLNFDMRALRREHIARMQVTPDVVVLGGEQWQEAHAGLMPHVRFYNAHVHRDYAEDILAVTELLVRHERLPRTMIIGIRDRTFSPPATRADWWWKFFLPEYRAMANRIGAEQFRWTETLSAAYLRELLSFRLFRTRFGRWLTADAMPGPTRETTLDDMDLLLPDGSIQWSRRHQALFGPDFAMADVTQAATRRKNDVLPIDDRAVEAMDRLIGFLRGQGVRVVLAYAPLHPALHEQLAGTPYREGLARIAATVEKLSDRHGLEVVGSFDARAAGCMASMFIDGEHANADCLRRLIGQVPAGVAERAPRHSAIGLRGSM